MNLHRMGERILLVVCVKFGALKPWEYGMFKGSMTPPKNRIEHLIG